MQISSDYRELLKILNRYKVRYLIVGAYAVIFYSEPRFTKDLDIWVEPSSKNAGKVYKALKGFGAPLKDVAPKDFTDKKLVYQIGISPVRVDIIMGVTGVEFDFAWKLKSITTFDNIQVNIIGIDELIKSKEKIKRTQDMLDLKSLRYTLKQNQKR